mgnify:FL=1
MLLLQERERDRCGGLWHALASAQKSAYEIEGGMTKAQPSDRGSGGADDDDDDDDDDDEVGSRYSKTVTRRRLSGNDTRNIGVVREGGSEVYSTREKEGRKGRRERREMRAAAGGQRSGDDVDVVVDVAVAHRSRKERGRLGYSSHYYNSDADLWFCACGWLGGWMAMSRGILDSRTRCWPRVIETLRAVEEPSIVLSSPAAARISPTSRPTHSRTMGSENRVRLIVSDIDGTLLNDAKEVSQATIAALRRASELGIAIALASGRKTSSIRLIAAQLGVPCYIIGYNGAEIRHGDEQLLHEPLPITVSDVVRWLLAMPLGSWLLALADDGC